MSALTTTPHTPAALDRPVRHTRASAAPLVRLLAGVALASAAAGGAAALALEKLVATMQPPIEPPPAS